MNSKLLLLLAAILPSLAMAQSAPPKPNPFSKAPVVTPPAGGHTPAGGPGMMPPSPNGKPYMGGPETYEEVVPGSLIGKVNGWNVFKAENGYLFDKTKEKNYIKRPTLKLDEMGGGPGVAPAHMPLPSAIPTRP